jgi:predicted enzyme related to lactoylglutathione lyase
MAHALNWFEIPVTNMGRAIKFYSTILGSELQVMETPEGQMAFFPSGENDIGGALTQGQGSQPSMNGTLVYLNAGEDLSQALDRVEAAGGKVTQPKTDIGEYGFVAYFTDTEGNKVGLHSMK